MVPLKPTPDLILFRHRLKGIYPVLDDSDGVGFETMCYYLIITTIKDLYCAVLQEVATTCDFAVTNCHGIYFPHFQSEIIAKMPSPFEIKIISIRPPGFEPGTPTGPRPKAPASGISFFFRFPAKERLWK